MRANLWVPAIAVMASFIGGCSSDPIGVWDSREQLPNGKRNELEIFDDEGELTMYAQIQTFQGLVRLDYNLKDWFLEADGNYELQFECKKGCDALVNINPNFEMDCEYDTDNEHLNCESKSPWVGYGFFEFEVQEGS